MEKRTVKIGDVVTFVNPVGKRMPALVTAVWGKEVYPDDNGMHPSINVVYVEEDESRTDSFGRQIGRQTSVCHRMMQAAHGQYWE